MARKVGRRIDVLIDEIDAGAAVGRSAWDAPEIDGKVILPDEPALRPGDLVKAEVFEAGDYDLIARRV